MTRVELIQPVCQNIESRRSTTGTLSRIDNVITSIEFEHLADPMGPTGGKLVRPSGGKEAKKIAVIQCAGSRDRNYLMHCSRTSRMATFEQRINVGNAFDEDDNISVY